MIRKFRDKVKDYLREVWKIKTTPHSIALGVAFGTLISILPTPFMNLLIGLLVILIFKNVSKISLLAALAFWNPITLAPIYYFSYKIGNMIFGSLPVIKYHVEILDFIYNFSRRFLVGNLILAVSFSLSFYAITYLIAWKVQNRKSKK